MSKQETSLKVVQPENITGPQRTILKLTDHVGTAEESWAIG